jgi:hypothetical protein
MSVGFNGSFPALGGVGARAPRDRISKASMLSPPLVRCHQGFAPALRAGIPRFEGAARKAGAHAEALRDAARRASRYRTKSGAAVAPPL